MPKIMKLMDREDLMIMITEFEVELDILKQNYNVLQEYYRHISNEINVTLNSVRDNVIMYEEVERQKLEYEEESEKQFRFINSSISLVNMKLTYYRHRLTVITFKQMYGRKYKYYINTSSENLPLYTFENMFELENYLFHVKQDECSDLTLDIFETK